MRLALDTNRYVDFAKNVPEALERIREADQVFIQRETRTPSSLDPHELRERIEVLVARKEPQVV